MTRKNDLVCWVYLSDAQQKIYQDFLQLDDTKEVHVWYIIKQVNSPLASDNSNVVSSGARLTALCKNCYIFSVDASSFYRERLLGRLR